MNKSQSLLFIACLVGSGQSFAAVCTPDDGTTRTVTYDLSVALLSGLNTVGSYVELERNFNQTIKARCTVPGFGEKKEFRTTRHYIQMSGGESFTLDGWKYIPVNEYLAVAMEITDGTIGTYYPPISQKMGVSAAVPLGKPFPVLDTSLKLRVMVINPFIGEINIPSDVLFMVKANTNDSPIHNIQPLYLITYTGNVTSKEVCDINTNNVLEMKFGKISASAFQNAGVGNKPENTNVQTRNLDINCRNFDYAKTLSVRVQTDRADGDMIISNNPSVGFKISDVDNNILTPNDRNSVYRFNLTQSSPASGYATVPIKAWPVSVDGQKPPTGAFYSSVFLRIDFQ